MTVIDTYAWIGEFDDLAPYDRLAAAVLVVEGKAVAGNAKEIAIRLGRARTIALIRERSTGRIVGVASLKSPDPKYRLGVFAKAGADMAGFEGAPELGYVVVAEDMRGRRLSGELVDLIATDLSEPTFATTDSKTMRNNLSRSGFRQAGREWKGRKGFLSLWTRASI